jgi:hypothetical protein
MLVGHFLLQRARAFGHSIKPPILKIDHSLAFLLLLLLLHGAAGHFVRHAQLGQALHSFGVGLGPFGVRCVVGELLVIDEGSDRGLGREGGELFDFLRGAAEAGAIQEVRRGVEVPLLPVDGLQHTIN